MVQSYDHLMGSDQDVNDHPDNSQNYKMAGDVVPIRPMSGMDIYSRENTKAAAGQVVNRSIAKGAMGGYSNNDMTNIQVLRAAK